MGGVVLLDGDGNFWLLLLGNFLVDSSLQDFLGHIDLLDQESEILGVEGVGQARGAFEEPRLVGPAGEDVEANIVARDALGAVGALHLAHLDKLYNRVPFWLWLI